MTWHMATCSVAGCGRQFPSLSPMSSPCPDTDYHWNLQNKASRSPSAPNLKTPEGKKGRMPAPLPQEKKGCDMVLLPAGAIVVGAITILVKALRR